ncbi:MAG: hypothetical protein LLF89_06845 [Spirochaetaceae bacterium]|nr:hypothetical protein [Spirochaetaceae bacterium]
MARIRTVKPAFFRHEELQALEAKHLGKFPMLVFEGLWTQSDKEGRFEWKPRQLKLDILPFLDFDMEETLIILARAGFLYQYEAEGKKYGCIPSFSEHQRISGKEAQQDPQYPEPAENRESFQHGPSENHTGSDGEAPGKQPGPPGRAGIGIGKRKGNNRAALPAPPDFVPVDTWALFVQHRVDLKKPMSANAANLIFEDLAKWKAKGQDPGEILKKSIKNGWTGVFELSNGSNGKGRTVERGDLKSTWVVCPHCRKEVLPSDLEDGRCIHCAVRKPLSEIKSMAEGIGKQV